MFLLSSYSKTDQEGARNTFPVLFKPLSLSYSVAKENFRSPSQLLHGNCITCPELHQQPNLETVQTVQDDSPPLMSHVPRPIEPNDGNVLNTTSAEMPCESPVTLSCSMCYNTVPCNGCEFSNIRSDRIQPCGWHIKHRSQNHYIFPHPKTHTDGLLC